MAEGLSGSYPGPSIFAVKDSGNRQEFESGMKRDTNENKTLYDLVFDGPMFERLAVHLTKGAQKYDARNWMKASGDAELTRFRESAIRHFIQWMRGDVDEDHAAAVMFNINGAEYVKERQDAMRKDSMRLQGALGKSVRSTLAASPEGVSPSPDTHTVVEKL